MKCRLLRREDLECSGLSTVAEGPTSLQQEADNVYQLLDLGRKGREKIRSELEDVRKHKHASLLCREWKGIGPSQAKIMLRDMALLMIISLSLVATGTLSVHNVR